MPVEYEGELSGIPASELHENQLARIVQISNNTPRQFLGMIVMRKGGRVIEVGGPGEYELNGWPQDLPRVKILLNSTTLTVLDNMRWNTSGPTIGGRSTSERT